MKGYVIIYCEPPSIDWRFFRCNARSGDHAERQFSKAFPAGDIVGVYLGDFAGDALRAMQREMGWDQTDPNLEA